MYSWKENECIWRSWYSNGNKQYEHMYENGQYTEYNIHEKVILNGNKEGFWFDSVDGYEGEYKNGKKDGKWMELYNDKEIECYYRDGFEFTWIIWFEKWLVRFFKY